MRYRYSDNITIARLRRQSWIKQSTLYISRKYALKGQCCGHFRPLHGEYEESGEKSSLFQNKLKLVYRYSRDQDIDIGLNHVSIRAME